MAQSRKEWQREFAILQASLVWGLEGSPEHIAQLIKTGHMPTTGRALELSDEAELKVAKLTKWIDEHGRVPTGEEAEQIING